MLLAWLSSIPATVWSALLASLLTLGGVVVSNRSNNLRLLRQLRHDSDEKAKERTSAMRREVYIATVEELTKANGFLGSIAQADLTQANATTVLQGFFTAAAKLQLVAEPDTALQVQRLVADFSELVLRLMGPVLPLQQARGSIQIHDQLYQEANVEVKRVLAALAQFNEGAGRDEAVFQALQRSLDGFRQQAARQADLRQQAWRDFQRQNVDFARQLFREQRAMSESQLPVMIAIRRDLGLTSNLEDFAVQMQASIDRMGAQFDAALVALERAAAEQDER